MPRTPPHCFSVALSRPTPPRRHRTPCRVLSGRIPVATLSATALLAGAVPAAVAEIAPAPVGADGQRLIKRVDAAAGGDTAAFDEGFFGPRRGLWEWTLSGAGESDTGFDSSGANVSLDANHYLRRFWSVGARQTLGVVENAGDSSWNAATSLFSQYHFGRGQLRPFVGAEAGYLFGDGVTETFFGGPEAGARFYFRDHTFFEGRVSYGFLLDSDDGAATRFDDGRLVYTFGVGFSF